MFPVVMCHGWPELWYSWRHQLTALADAGFRAIAPDMRGYGETDAPADPAAVPDHGHLRRHPGAPRRARARARGHRRARLGRLSPLAVRAPPPRAVREAGRPQHAVRAPGPGAADPGAPRAVRRGRLLHALAPDGPAGRRPSSRPTFAETSRRSSRASDHARDLWTMATLGGDGSGLFARVSEEGCFLTDAELDVYVRAFAQTGTRGSFNWYRALDLNWEDARRIADPTIRVPSLMITAENDPILRPAQAEPMPTWIPGLRIEQIRRCSHWTQQERPDEVNRLLLGVPRRPPLSAESADARGGGGDPLQRGWRPAAVRSWPRRPARATTAPRDGARDRRIFPREIDGYSSTRSLRA